MSRCQRECQEFDPPILLQIIIMYRIYYTDPKSQTVSAADTDGLAIALHVCESLRREGMTLVVMVSDYADMVGKPGAKGAGSEYVAQMLN